MMHVLLAKLSDWGLLGIPALMIADTSAGTYPFGIIASGGILGWHLYYTMRVERPRQEAAQAKLIADHAMRMKEQADRYEAILDKQNDQHREDQTNLKVSVDKLCESLQSGDGE